MELVKDMLAGVAQEKALSAAEALGIIKTHSARTKVNVKTELRGLAKKVLPIPATLLQ
ncbi:MAG: hypothetical protein ACFFBS_05005 [Promethearchaeota archaeon]